MNMHRSVVLLSIVAALVGLGLATWAGNALPASALPGFRAPEGDAAPTAIPVVMDGPLAGDPVTPTLSIAVRDLPDAEPWVMPGGEIDRRKPPLSQLLGANLSNEQNARDPLVALGASNVLGFTPAPILNIQGLSNTCACSPPDTIGDVGPNHYVQMVNATTLVVLDKNGTQLITPKQLRTLWTSGNCSASQNSDPVVVYSLADRWCWRSSAPATACAWPSRPRPTRPARSAATSSSPSFLTTSRSGCGRTPTT
jgi:hypothetical protein